MKVAGRPRMTMDLDSRYIKSAAAVLSEETEKKEIVENLDPVQMHLLSNYFLKKDILIPILKMLKCAMSLRRIFEEREKNREILQQNALREARRLASLLKERYEYDSIYLYGSILSKRFGNRSDIDIIIKGLRTDAFFKAYAFLIGESNYRIDLKPFEDMTADFQGEVLTEGVRIG